MKLIKLLIFCFSSILFSVYAQAQDVTVNGIVNDENGMPVPGASVVIKGTGKGTSSDFDGKFQLKAPSNGALTITFIGYTTINEPINGRNRIIVQLRSESQALNEVVVIGYGTQKKSVVTGAISKVRSQDIENLPISRVEQTLQGRVSGVTIAASSGQPGASSNIRVRGITTLGNNNPLWVVDGVVVDAGGIGYLNQSDIASIEVLKDAASQAIYGARAAAGVIIVTTKKGKSGKMSVSYNGYTGFSSAARKLDLLNATEYATLRNEKYANGYVKKDPTDTFALPFPNSNALGAGTDWQSVIFNDSAARIGQELSLSGGNDVSTFYASFGLLEQEGIVTTDISKYNRKNIRLNSTHKISKSITFGQTLGFSREKTTGLGNTNSLYGGPLASAINLDPITPAIVTDPNMAALPPYSVGISDGKGIIRDPNGNPYGVSTIVTREMSNPLAYTQTRLGNYDWADNFVGNAYMEVELIKGLKFRTTLGGKLAYWGFENFTPVAYLNSDNITKLNNLSRNTNKGFGWNIENVASYTKSIANHNFSVLVGQGAYVDNRNSGTTITYTNLPIDSYKDASFNFNLPKDQINATATTGNEHRVTSIFSRLTYDFKEKYLLTGIIRRDGSSRFGSNNKYGTFPSFSLGWVPTKETFWVENKVVNQLKFRGGYGVTGNDNIGDFKYLATVGDGRNYTIGTSGSVTIGNSPNAPSNPDLKWEETSQTNIGLEATFFNDFNLTFDWYIKKTTGILQEISLPGYVGSGNPTGNVADMENRGIDLELGYRKKIGQLNVSLNANVSYLKNEVTYLGRGIDFLPSGEQYQAATYDITRTQVGQPYGSFYGFKTAGIFQNQNEVNAYKNAAGGLIQPDAKPGDFRWTDIDGDGKITADDRTFIGSPIPKYTFGFTINLDYKNFDLLIFTQGAAGNKIFQGLRRLDIENSNYQTKALGRWTGEGTSNTFPRLTSDDKNKNFNNPSDFYLEKGDYVRLKTIQLGYSLPTKVIGQIGLEKTRVYLTGENLFTFTKYTGFDPEIGANNADGNVMGIDRGFYPQARTIMLGVNLQF